MYEWIEFIISYGEGFNPEQIKNETREGEIVYARQLIHYFSVLFDVGTLKWIGEQTGGKDHATVMHSVKVINNYRDTNKTKRSKIDYYEKLINKLKDLNKQANQVKSIVAPLEREISQLEQRCINLSLQISFIKSNLST
jgi:hypothetical protein